jgi:hypothetical protein
MIWEGEEQVMAANRQKFATQVNARTLAAVRRLAEKEGRQLQALVEEALNDLLEKHRNDRPRAHVLDAYRRSLAQYSEVYKKLAR